jgi:hypothetical protein
VTIFYTVWPPSRNYQVEQCKGLPVAVGTCHAGAAWVLRIAGNRDRHIAAAVHLGLLEEQRSKGFDHGLGLPSSLGAKHTPLSTGGKGLAGPHVGVPGVIRGKFSVRQTATTSPLAARHDYI